MKNTKGFTLIELLVVITIIGILSVGAVQLFSNSQDRARDSVRITDMKTLESSLGLYFADTSTYPVAADGGTDATVLGKDDLEATLEGTYVNQVPSDPENGAAQRYAYVIDAAAPTEFEVSAALVSATNDGQEDNDGGNNGDTYEVGTDTDTLGAASANADLTPSATQTNF